VQLSIAIVAACRHGFFSFIFCDVAIPNITQGKIQIWLQVREESGQ
jgi:hypothetical protein